MKTADFGSIISGTINPDDTVPVFAEELRRLRGTLPKAFYNRIRALGSTGDDTHYDDALELANDLIDALNEFAPAYGYFGSHPDDGADFGFWLSENWEESFDGLRVVDTSEVPAGYSGEVLHVSCHGNPTLYAAYKGALTEVWALV